MQDKLKTKIDNQSSEKLQDEIYGNSSNETNLNM
jgi:hypothetical protein